ncbi:uncharacterized protein LOC128667974 [Microplitis demolitor]|uniref:uncharacterized protein LOC128667974 n=1 Tax=Microplitis demolitor TaxID=69319 RepID=UPI00235B5E91|nr:uncharacterized protein LOC128667974 [Microplitis demolitor]
MAHCTTSISWFISKFFFNFFSIIFVYAGFLKEKQIECLCAAAERDYKRQKAKGVENRSRCMCHRWRSSVYPCGCKRKKIFGDCYGDTNGDLVTKQEEVTSNKCCCGK